MKKTLLAVLLGSFALASFAQPITIEKQGAFSAGGTVIEAKKTFDPYHPEPDAMTLHGDHANVIYQIPAHAKNVSLMFLHGAGQSMRTWQTTPDGREGFQSAGPCIPPAGCGKISSRYSLSDTAPAVYCAPEIGKGKNVTVVIFLHYDKGRGHNLSIPNL